MSFQIVIPARYDSERLPGKPLADIGGKPMLQRTWEQACLSEASVVTIATDDERIADRARAFGAEVVMTATEHRSGTDRIQEVTTRLGLSPDAIVVNVQADEPLIPPRVINQVAVNLAADSEAGIATLCEPIQSAREWQDPNAVKVVFGHRGQALYFSRASIPHGAEPAGGRCYRHIGIYAYRVATLDAFVSWPPGELERSERLEQLRALEHGIVIQVAVADEAIPAGVDTVDDLEAVRRHLAETLPA